ncbi:hypothetical protein QBC46DRAFT_171023 [Diplogelasinospora grovesii]|uniref:2EXR domain-containing protein n=1 Tax=Diplogelasinospora grovesii TaxID=303347 RepID=A0AAN6N2U8_9PEZI|nr:hypothetical protein QBC46DRAFT_171023 [Diplogelasinospora grovesii]
MAWEASGLDSLESHTHLLHAGSVIEAQNIELAPSTPKFLPHTASAAPAVTVTELSGPLAAPVTEAGRVLSPTTAFSTFPQFPLLPAELRLKIWQLSFVPRTIELHTRRTHYADDNRRGGTPKWQSLSRNPAALSVSAEARAAALEFYSVALPLAAPLARGQTFERPGDLLLDPDRVLYLNLETDMVVVLGDLQFARLTRLLDWFRTKDIGFGAVGRRQAQTHGKGLRRLALSVAPWAHESGARTLGAFALTVFANIEEFVLFMYTERMPPQSWAGGVCLLQDCEDDDYYKRFAMERGKQFREGQGWMVVGKRAMKVVDIQFVDGW